MAYEGRHTWQKLTQKNTSKSATSTRLSTETEMNLRSGVGPGKVYKLTSCPKCKRDYSVLICGSTSAPVNIDCDCGHSYTIEAQEAK